MILNDHPVTKISDDPNDLEPLTPNHILLLKGKPSGFVEKGTLICFVILAQCNLSIILCALH